MRDGRTVVVAVVICLAAGSSAAAQEARAPIEAHVVRIDGEDIFVDVGTAEARRGLELEVYRTIEVRHPVTRARLRDRFAIGKVRIVSLGETLSIARVVGTPHRAIEVGDAAETDRPEAAGPQPVPSAEPLASAAACPACPSCECPASDDPHTQEIVAVWRATLGKPPEERERLYGIFLQRNPQSPYVASVRSELEAMREIRTREASLRAQAVAGMRDAATSARHAVSTTPLERALEGQPVEIAATIAPGSEVRRLTLYVRHIGEPEYHAIPMEPDPVGHARASVPASYVASPGFDYFVEASVTAGNPIPVVGSGVAPQRVQVIGEEPAPAPVDRSRVRFSTELVSFNGFEGNDWYVVAEGDFLYRTLLGPLYGVRMGYGHFLGEGGTVEDLDERGLAPERAGFTYGYLETELRVSTLFALMTRATVGLGRPERENDSGLRGGFQLRVRIGEERGTNLVLAGETIPEIGQRAYIGLTWVAIERWPMTAEVHVTDQPANTDELGVRGVFELGFEATGWAALAARVSYQGRTIDHAGLGAGLAATFDW